MQLTYLILTGGQSLRFGSHKRDALFRGKTFLDNIISSIPKERNILVAGSVTIPLPKDVICINDVFINGGPVAGIFSGIKAVKDPHVAVIATDMPLGVTAIEEMWEKRKSLLTKFEAVIPMDSQGKSQYLCAIYQVNALQRVLGRLQTPSGASIKKVLIGLNTTYVQLESQSVLFDIDTQADLFSFNYLSGS